MKALRINRGILVALALACSANAAGADSIAARCEAGKNQEAGKYAACLHKAEAKLAKAKGSCSTFPVGEVCYSSVDCMPYQPHFDVCTKDRTGYDTAVAECATKFEERWAKLTQKAIDKSASCPDAWQFVDVRDAVAADVAAGVARVAYVLSGMPRFFTEAGDGTIFDGKTGLTWERKVRLDGWEDHANLHDADNTYLWSGSCSIGGAFCQPDAASEAACLAGVEGDATGCAQCLTGVCNVASPDETVWQWLAALRAANFAGHSDWRLATREELVSIIEYGETDDPVVGLAFHAGDCGAACTDVTDSRCSCTRSSLYWSASTHAPSSGAAWYVFFDDGAVPSDGKSNLMHVRAVRGGS